MYIYVCMYVCLDTYMYMYIYVYMYMYVYMYVCICVYMYICIASMYIMVPYVWYIQIFCCSQGTCLAFDSL